MNWQVTAYVAALVGAAGILGVLALLIWPRRAVRGGTPLFFLLVAVAEWVLATVFETTAVGIPAKIFWSKVQYVGITTAPVLFLAFALEYGQLERWLTRRNLALLFVMPLLTFALAATNERHHLIWTTFTFSDNTSNILTYGHGSWFWMSIAYTYVLLSAGILVLIRATIRYRHVYRRQAALNLVAGLIPCVGNILYLSGWGFLPGQDLTPVTFALTGIVLSVNILRFRFLDLVPVARDALVGHMRDGVLVLDAQDRVVDMNPAARDLLGGKTPQLGDDMASVMGPWPELVAAWQTADEVRTEVRLCEEPPCYADIRISRLDDRRRRLAGKLVIVHDTTQRKQAESERERLILELQEALASVKTLRGLLPICANCKKVRDDAGYWRTVEEYVTQHSEAQFSHGICPECMRELYPWFVPEEE